MPNVPHEAFASSSVLIDRTEELYQNLEQSNNGEFRMELLQFDFVLAPGKTRRKIVGPADILALLYHGSITLHIVVDGERPAPPRVYANEA